MKEVHKIININDMKVKAFQFGTIGPHSLYLPCNRHGLVPSVVDDETSKIVMQDSYLLIGRNFKHWKACLEYQNSNINELAPKEMRPLQRFQPLVVLNGSTASTSSPNSRAETPKPELFEAENLTENSLFIPRQRLLLAFISKNDIQLVSLSINIYFSKIGR